MPFIGPGNTVRRPRAAPVLDEEEERRRREPVRQSTQTEAPPPAKPSNPQDALVRTRQTEAAAPPPRRGRDPVRGGTQEPASPWDEFLDPQSAAWLRGLFGPTDTSAQEDMARQQSEAALGRGKANLEARGGMGGMGLMGGQIAMGADLERQSATELADQILGIQDQAAQRDLQRGTVAAEFLDRGVGRGLQAQEIGKDDAMTYAVLAEMGLKPTFDDEGNLTGFDDVGQEGEDPRLTDDDPTNDAAAVQDQAADFEEQFADVPEPEFFDNFNFTGLTGEEEVATWTRPDGSTVTVYQRDDGTTFKIVR